MNYNETQKTSEPQWAIKRYNVIQGATVSHDNVKWITASRNETQLVAARLNEPQLTTGSKNKAQSVKMNQKEVKHAASHNKLLRTIMNQSQA